MYLKVVEKKELVSIKRLDGSMVVITDFLVGDETGVVQMRLRNGLQINRKVLRHAGRRPRYRSAQLQGARDKQAHSRYCGHVREN